MEVRFHIPYYEPTELSFKADKDYFKDGEYVRAMVSEERRTRDAVMRSMTGVRESVGGMIITEYDPNRSMRHSGMKVADDVVRYAVCDGRVYGPDGRDETSDGIFDNFSRQEPCVYMFEFGEEVCDDEFMREIKVWSRDHHKLAKYAQRAGEEWVFQHEPLRDIFAKFRNLSGKEVTVSFRDCRIMDVADRQSLIVLVDRVSIVDNMI